MNRALVVLSGGQDSTTCLFWAKSYFKEVHTITFDYAQRHHREIQAACDVATLAGVDSHEVVSLGPILQGRSPLTNPDEELELYESHETMAEIIGDRVEKTFVPMRNALFLTLAANRAACLDIQHLVTGVCQEDNANYPDCREVFIDAQAAAIREALGIKDFDIHTPLMHLSKAQTVGLSRSLPGLRTTAYIALAFSHTAYDGSYPPVSKDHANTLRAQGFLEANLPDPLVLRACREGLMEMPTTDNYNDKEWCTQVADKIIDLSRLLGK